MDLFKMKNRHSHFAMIQVRKIFLGFVLLMPMHFAFAQGFNSDCKADCVEKEALPVLKEAILHAPLRLPQSADCPEGGIDLFENVAMADGTVVASSSIISALTDKTSAYLNDLSRSSGRCGSCQQHNLVTPFTESQPEKLRLDVVCTTPFTKNIQREIEDTQIEDYAAATLKGDNPEGKALHDACSSSCNFHVATAKTPISSTRSRLNLTVLCGPPRQGFILFATYQYKIGFFRQWTCSK